MTIHSEKSHEMNTQFLFQKAYPAPLAIKTPYVLIMIQIPDPILLSFFLKYLEIDPPLDIIKPPAHSQTLLTTPGPKSNLSISFAHNPSSLPNPPIPSRLILGLVLTTLLSGVISSTPAYPGGCVPSLS
jgi:hypothetical protein